MNKIEKNKSHLLVFSILVLIFGLLMMGGGITLVVLFSKNFEPLYRTIILIVVGVAMILLGLCSLGYFVAIKMTHSAITATNGSFKEENLAMNKNMKDIDETDGEKSEKPEKE